MADAPHDRPTTDPRTPEQIAAEIAQQRERLAGTVDELAAKLDVKAQARRTVARPEVVAAASLVAMALVLLLWRRRRHG